MNQNYSFRFVRNHRYSNRLIADTGSNIWASILRFWQTSHASNLLFEIDKQSHGPLIINIYTSRFCLSSGDKRYRSQFLFHPSHYPHKIIRLRFLSFLKRPDSNHFYCIKNISAPFITGCHSHVVSLVSPARYHRVWLRTTIPNAVSAARRGKRCHPGPQ